MKKQEKKLEGRLQRRAVGYRELQAKYNELIMAVESKFPGETTHETALRYIKDREGGAVKIVGKLTGAWESYLKEQQ